jgi:predicted phosphodiesterase
MRRLLVLFVVLFLLPTIIYAQQEIPPDPSSDQGMMEAPQSEERLSADKVEISAQQDTMAATADTPPIGGIYSVTTGSEANFPSPGLVTGWAADRNAADGKTMIELYWDAPTGSTALLGSVQTNIWNKNFFLQNGYGKFSLFQYQIPVEKLYDGRAHTLYAYAVNVTVTGSPGTKIALPGSPRTIPIIPRPSPVPLAIHNLMIASPTQRSVTIVVHTGKLSNATVHYGTTASYGQVKSSTNKKIHKIVVDGLSPDTQYQYKVTVSDATNTTITQTSGARTFRTAKPAGRNFTLGIISDMQRQDWTTVATHIKARNPDLLIFPGDNSDNSGLNKIEQFEYYRDRWQKDVFNYSKRLTETIPSYFVMGNHDEFNINATWNFRLSGQYFAELMANPNPNGNTDNYYSFDYGDVHFVALNTHAGCITPEQKTWMQTDLRNTSQRWKLIFLHIPNNNPTGVSSCRVGDFAYSETVRAIWEQEHVDLVINGHSHTYHRWVKNNIYYLTNTTAGGDLRWPAYPVPTDNPGDAGTLPQAIEATGYMYAVATPGKITFYSYNDSNALIDTFFLTKQITSIPGDLTDNGDSATDHVNIFDYNHLVSFFRNPFTIFDYNNIVANFAR